MRALFKSTSRSAPLARLLLIRSGSIKMWWFDSEKEKSHARLFGLFFSSSLSFKRYTQTTTKEKRKSRDTTTRLRAKLRQRKNSSNSSLSPLLKKHFHRLRGERKRHQREQKRKSEELVLLRETFFFPLREKKSASLISSHLCWKDYASSTANRRKRRRRRWWRWRWWDEWKNLRVYRGGIARKTSANWTGGGLFWESKESKKKYLPIAWAEESE